MDFQLSSRAHDLARRTHPSTHGFLRSHAGELFISRTNTSGVDSRVYERAPSRERDFSPPSETSTRWRISGLTQM